MSPAAHTLTDAERHEAVVAKYPGGLSPEQFRIVTLESADATGRVYPPSIADPFAWYSLIFKMLLDGHLHRRGGHNDPIGPLFITPAGQEALATREAR